MSKSTQVTDTSDGDALDGALTFNLLEALSEDSSITQRKVATELGIEVG